MYSLTYLNLKLLIEFGKMDYCFLKQNDVGESLLQLITSFSSDRFQRVIFYSQTLDWKTLCTVVPQGSILEPLSFIIYI